MSSDMEPSTLCADFPRCIECGGFGLGLVTNPQKLCTHCARVTKAFFDPDSNRFCRDEGFVDISPGADGGVLKKVRVEWVLLCSNEGVLFVTYYLSIVGYHVVGSSPRK